MRIIEELYYGNIVPNATSIEPGSEYDLETRKSSEIEEKLISLLDGKEKEMFMDYVLSLSSILAIHGEKNFAFGFKLGMLLTTETFHDAQEILTD